MKNPIQESQAQSRGQGRSQAASSGFGLQAAPRSLHALIERGVVSSARRIRPLFGFANRLAGTFFDGGGRVRLPCAPLRASRRRRGFPRHATPRRPRAIRSPASSCATSCASPFAPSPFCLSPLASFASGPSLFALRHSRRRAQGFRPQTNGAPRRGAPAQSDFALFYAMIESVLFARQESPRSRRGAPDRALRSAIGGLRPRLLPFDVDVFARARRRLAKARRRIPGVLSPRG